jgi:hypothetical protein
LSMVSPIVVYLTYPCLTLPVQPYCCLCATLLVVFLLSDLACCPQFYILSFLHFLILYRNWILIPAACNLLTSSESTSLFLLCISICQNRMCLVKHNSAFSEIFHLDHIHLFCCASFHCFSNLWMLHVLLGVIRIM